MRDIVSEGGAREGRSQIRALLMRRVWVPAGLYAAVPVLYLATAGLAFRSLWLLPGWSVVHSFFCAVGVCCSYAGGAVITLRWQSWQRRRAIASTTPDHA